MSAVTMRRWFLPFLVLTATTFSLTASTTAMTATTVAETTAAGGTIITQTTEAQTSTAAEATTAAAATTMAQTTVQYSTQKPDLAGAEIGLEFSLTAPPEGCDKENLDRLKAGIADTFRNLEGYVGESASCENGQPAARRKRDTASSQEAVVEVVVHFDAGAVFTTDEQQLQNFKANVSAALEELNRTLENTSFSLNAQEAVDLDAFVATLKDACLAQRSTPLCSRELVCVNSTCYHRCQFHSCSDHGTCYVEIFNDVAEASCRCESDGVYDYGGPRCDDRTLQDRWIGAIAGGVAGVVVLVLILVVLIYCCCFRRRRDKHNTSLDNSSEDGYNRHYVATKYSTEYDNASFQKDTVADMYFPASGGRTDSDLLTRFYGNTDKPFVIQRPKVDLHPRAQSDWS